VLDVLLLGLRASPVAWTSFMEAFLQFFYIKRKKFQLYFFKFLVIKILDPYPEADPGSLEMLDPDPD
jgi:hypothetical protein